MFILWVVHAAVTGLRLLFWLLFDQRVLLDHQGLFVSPDSAQHAVGLDHQYSTDVSCSTVNNTRYRQTFPFTSSHTVYHGTKVLILVPTGVV